MTTKVVETKVVSVDISGLHDTMEINRPYTMHATGHLMPDRVDMRWERVDYGIWSLVRASVSGVRIKNNGEPGLTRATTWFVHSTRVMAGLPGWLADVEKEWKP